MFHLFRKAPDLKRAIAEVNASPSAKNQRALEECVRSSVLFVASPVVPEHWKGTVVLDGEVSIPVLTSEAPGGGVALLCFTDADEVRRRTTSDSCFGLRFLDVCRLVARHDYAGIIINPAGPWAGLPGSRLRELGHAA